MAIIFITLRCASAARILDEVDPLQPPVVTTPPDQPSNPAATIVPPAATLPSGQFPAVAAPGSAEEDAADPPAPDDVSATVAPPAAADVAAPPSDEAAPGTTPPTTTTPTTTATVTPPAATVVAPPVAGPTTALPAGTGAVTGATVANPGPQGEPMLSFFMHDIVGGSHPSARTVTGIIAKTEINGIPFSKINSNFFPLSGGTPLLTTNNLNNIVNPQNLPFLTGLNGAQPTTILQNTGNNNIVSGGDNQPFVTAGQLPAGATIQKLMFGSITVIDDELTEGHELGSAVLGRAQGFYLASSLDGTSQSVALTVLLHGGEHEAVEDTISFFGVHRTASPESQVAVVGGTGKYENARGYATLETLHQEDQHTTDGVDTILHFSVYLSE